MKILVSIEPGLIGIDPVTAIRWVRVAGYEGEISEGLWNVDGLILKFQALTVGTLDPRPFEAQTWPFRASIDIPGRGSVSSPEFPPSQIESIRRWVLGALLDIGRDLGLQEVVTRSISIRVERLADELLSELRTKNSRLRGDLEQSRIRVAFLEGQVEAMLEAKRTGRKSILAASLSVVSAILLAMASGAGKAASQQFLENKAPTAAGLAHECSEIAHLLDLPDVTLPDEP